LTEESFSESCSDVDVHNDVAATTVTRDVFATTTTSPRFHPSATRGTFAVAQNIAFSNESSPRSLGPKPRPLPSNMSQSFTAKSSRTFSAKTNSSSSSGDNGNQLFFYLFI
jgi:hypothetical protein